MDWKDIAGVVGKAAPILGTLLGGPVGGAVGGLISSALGVENTPDAISQAIATDPAAAEKLREAELNSKAQLQQLVVTHEQQRLQFALQSYQAEAGDRNSARELAAKQPGDYMRPVLGFAIVGAMIAMAIIIVSGHATEVLSNPIAGITVGTIIGALLSEGKTVLGFYFGMTQDSKTTNEVVRNFAVAPGTVTGSDAAATINATTKDQ